MYYEYECKCNVICSLLWFSGLTSFVFCQVLVQLVWLLRLVFHFSLLQLERTVQWVLWSKTRLWNHFIVDVAWYNGQRYWCTQVFAWNYYSSSFRICWCHQPQSRGNSFRLFTILLSLLFISFLICNFVSIWLISTQLN